MTLMTLTDCRTGLLVQEVAQDSTLRGWNNPGSPVDLRVFLRPNRLLSP